MPSILTQYTDLVDVQEVAGVGLGALVDPPLLRPYQEEMISEGIEPDGRTRTWGVCVCVCVCVCA